MPRRPPAPDLPSTRFTRAGFVREGDYVDRFLADALKAAPQAPLAVVKALWWLLLQRGVRARSRLQEIVGRRLGFARPNRLRPIAPLRLPAQRPRVAAIVPVMEGVSPERVGTTVDSLPTDVEAVIAASRPLAGLPLVRQEILPDARNAAELVNRAAQSCDHDVLLVLHPGNVLLSGASDRLAAALADPAVEAVYGDEVLALPGLTLPLLKPDFDEDLLLQTDYVGDFLGVRRQTFLALGGYVEAPDPPPARDFLLRLSAHGGAGAVGHVQGPVHGKDLREAPRGTAPELLSSTQAYLRATQADANTRSGPSGRVEILRNLPKPPPVTVIVPTRDRADLFVPCLDGLLHATDYPDLDIIVADNGSTEPETLARFAAYAADPRIRIAPMPGPFNFSRINNDAVALARGSVLVFMNNDVEVLERGWLTAMVAEAVRPDIGAVGAKLLYPNGLIQHAGVVTGLIGGPAGHAFHLFRDGHPGYLHMLETTRRVSAVTAACLAITREKFDAMGGFDAEAFPVALNDVDLCLRLDAAGYRNLYVAGACLLHKETASRPNDMRPDQRARYERELAAFAARWPHRLARDPWYNQGHGQALADFSVPHWSGSDWPPRRP